MRATDPVGLGNRQRLGVDHGITEAVIHRGQNTTNRRDVGYGGSLLAGRQQAS
jgi:hypothetical protein